MLLLHTTSTIIRTFWYQRGQSPADYQTIEDKTHRFFNNVTIIGYFSGHPLSHTLDCEILLGREKMSDKAKPPINLLQYSAEPIYKVFPSDLKVFANNPKDFIPDDIATVRQYW